MLAKKNQEATIETEITEIESYGVHSGQLRELKEVTTANAEDDTDE